MPDWSDIGIDTRGKATGHTKTLCPQCSHTRKKKLDPCLSVDLDQGVYHCFNCGWAGRLKAARDDYGTLPPIRKPDFVPQKPPPGNKGWAYLEGRGIGALWLTHYEVDYRPDVWMPQTGGPTGALCFPYRRGREIVNVKYRSGGKAFRMEKDAELILYGLNDIRADLPLIWVEGEIDKLSVAVAGIPNCVSVPNGAPQPGERESRLRYRYLDSAAVVLEPIRKHVIAVDNDEPGRLLAAELIRRLGPEKCWTVSWPEGCKDANDVLVKHGDKALLDALLGARQVPIEGLLDVGDFREATLDLYRHGLWGGAEPPSALLADAYKVRPGLWTLVTGIPSHGKSAFIDWLLVGLAIKHDWSFALCSPENQPVQRHIAALASLYTGLPFGTTSVMDEADLEDALAWLDGRFHFILPAESFTLDDILARAKAAVLRHGIKGLVIDPWNEIEHQRPAGVTETEYISQSLTTIRRFARLHDIHIWLIAHPAKLQKGPDGAYPVPTPYDVSGSAHWRNKADMALSIYRYVEEPERPIEVYVQKVRFRECGEIGVVPLHFDRYTGRYSDFPLAPQRPSAWQQAAVPDEPSVDAGDEERETWRL
jgi:twinkle protein